MQQIQRWTLVILIQKQQDSITSSINYARRIQFNLLPHERVLTSCFKEHFIIYKPKDIVSGDFYWMEPMGDTVYFAGADCTGHGVPGAMVSVVCSHALDRAVNAACTSQEPVRQIEIPKSTIITSKKSSLGLKTICAIFNV